MMILHVVPGLNEVRNGIAVAAKLIAAGQSKAGSEVEVVETREFVSDGGDSAFSRSSSRLLSAYEEVWVHSCWQWPTIRACRKVLNAGVPLVRMMHANLDPLRMRSKGWKKFPLWWLVERHLTNRATRVVVTCVAERMWCEQAGVNAPFEVLDLKQFFDLGEGGGEGEEKRRALHVLYLGRRHPLKGTEYLEAAIRRIQESAQSTSSPRLSKIELQVVSNAYGEEKERVWQWCDVLCLPTLSENFGLVIAEALERGKRVITTDGAPAWGDDCECKMENVKCEIGAGEIWTGYEGRLTYIKGYRDGSAEERIALLKSAIEGLVGRC